MHSQRGLGAFIPDEFWQRRANRREAQRALLRLKRAEELADNTEALDLRDDLSELRLMALRSRKQEEYRRVTGIEIEERAFVRPLLERLAETGEMTVAEAIHELRAGLRNGLVPDGIEGASSGAAEPDSMSPRDET